MNSLMYESYRKYFWACGFSLLIVAVCLLLVFQLGKHSAIRYEPLPTETYLTYFTSIGVIYALSYVLWRYFYSLFGRQRSPRDAFLDMGLIAIGKYLPGKIWGIALRGSFEQNTITLDKGRMLISGLEQAFSLVIGMLIVGALGLSTIWNSGWAIAVAGMACTIVIVPLLLPALKFCLGFIKRLRTKLTMPSVGRRLLLGAGYGLLWLVSAVPVIILMQSSMTLSNSGLVSITAAYLGSMIAGWIAIFAPGGIGVRESVFVMLAPDFLGWQEGLYWMALHRGLYTLFDILYGVLVLGLVAVRARSFAIR